MYLVICGLIAAYYMGLMLSFVYGWVTSKTEEKMPKAVKQAKISVIIACRDEEEKIARCLDSIMTQSYSKENFEVIVVNDHSSDNTAEIVRGYKNVTLLESAGSGKKAAIAYGISNTKGDIITITDADCYMGENWLTLINNEFNNQEVKMVCGPVSYTHHSSFFAKWQTMDMIGMVGMAGGGINIGAPNTCNGANLSYRKETFYEVDGFKGNDGIASGDDDFLMHKMDEKYKNSVRFLQNSNAIVYTDPELSLNKFIQQRARWVSKSTKYSKKSVTLIVVMLYLFNFSILFNFIAGFWYPMLMQIAVVLFGIKLAIEGVLFAVILPFFNKQKIFWIIIQSEVLHILYVVYIGIRGNVGKYIWKNRVEEIKK